MARVLSIKKTIEEANEAEDKEDISLAIKDYESAIDANPLLEKAYDRLMILYRKQKDYKNELRVINTGIRSFENFYKSRKSNSKKIAEISKKLNRSFGLTDKKGNAVYDPEPIARWKKRKMTVEKRAKK